MSGIDYATLEYKAQEARTYAVMGERATAQVYLTEVAELANKLIKEIDNGAKEPTDEQAR
jgi:hypothetical protein